jgi:hypothetical protein
MTFDGAIPPAVCSKILNKTFETKEPPLGIVQFVALAVRLHSPIWGQMRTIIVKIARRQAAFCGR